MPAERTQRRLAAILAADVVGYSRMMGADEAGTLTALKRHRESVFDPSVAAHGGRIVKLIGDGTLVEFSSVVDAVNCAVAIQRRVREEAVGIAGPPIVLRIGVNLGDVIIEGDDIYGDGVNIAARMEPLAEPGGICVASIVHESLGSRVDVAFTDGGQVQVKNIERPMRVWKWHPNEVPAKPAAAPHAPAPPPRQAYRPSIAVLPFDNMSGDAEQEYFSDGISEDIITDLSKVAGLTVIARNSSFAYKGKQFDIRTVGRELGVRSVLEGSIRRAANRVRITAQLINAEDGSHIWAERYDRDLTDIFAVQDEVTRRIVDALRVKLTPSEEARLTESTTSSVEAHDAFLKARQLLTRPTGGKVSFEAGVAQLNRAVEVDPDFGAAYSGLAFAYNLDFHNGWTDDPEGSLRKADRYATIAIEKSPNDPFAHYVAGVVAGFLKDTERAHREIDAALALSPNDALAINAKGVAETYAGHFEQAVTLIERAMQLDPANRQQYLHFLGLAYLLSHRYESAVAHLRERILLVPETDLSRAWLVAALGHLDRQEEARAVWTELMGINPRYSLDVHLGRLPFRPEDAALLREGVAKAGVG